MAKVKKSLNLGQARRRVEELEYSNNELSTVCSEKETRIEVLQKQMETLHKGYDDLREQKTKAWEIAGRWEKRAEELERDYGNLRQKVDEMEIGKARTIETLAGQLNRCIGFIAAKMEEHPAPEATPDKAPEGTGIEFAGGKNWSNDPRDKVRVSEWRRALGL